jgi:uncharacterized protein DUF1707
MRWQHEADEVANSAGPGTLASDADRDTAAGLLSEAFAEGRLTADEHGERARAAYAARTWAELARLTADLPVPADGAAGRPAAMPEGVDRCLLCALLVLCPLVLCPPVVLCPPAGIAWLLAARRRSRPGRGRPLVLGQAAGWAGHPARRQAGDALRLSTRRSGRGAGSRIGSGSQTVMPSAGSMSHGPGGMHAEDR